MRWWICFCHSYSPQACRGMELLAPLIRKLDTRWRWVASLMPRQLNPMTDSTRFPLQGRLDGSQTRSGHFREEKHVASAGSRNVVRPVRRLVTIPSSTLRSNVGCIPIHPLCSEPTPPRSVIFLFIHMTTFGGYAVTQLVKALCYKPEGRGFDSWWCHWNFSLT